MSRPNRKTENKLFSRGYSFIAGVDEVGRGAWAGPLVAAAVILPQAYRLAGLNDSKKISPVKREKLYFKIIKLAVAYRICIISNKTIDRSGLSQANQAAIRGCLKSLSVKPEIALIDAVNIKIRKIPTRSIVKGDAKISSIAAASIIAKVSRDRLMKKYHKKYPQYKFDKHKGYGTKEHRRTITKYGVCPQHRLSFKPIKTYTDK